MMPTFSVLMSVYKNDSPTFLKTALESIYDNQTLKPNEIVVVFDGPLTDELYDVLNDFKSGKDGVVKYYPQEQNKGLGEALRIGSLYCTCDYILRMDSDDISDDHRFEKQMIYLAEHPEIDVLGTDIAEFNTSTTEDMRKRVCPANHDDIVEMSKTRSPMNHVTVAINRNSLIDCGSYESILLLEDYYLWLKMIVSDCKFANINETLVYVRVGNGFNSKRGSTTRIKGWKKIQNYMLSNNMITRSKAFKNMLYIRIFVYTPSWLKQFLYKRFLRT